MPIYTFLPIFHMITDPSQKSPKLIPYPNELLNRTLYVAHHKVDTCDRLWFLDSATYRLYITDLFLNKVIRDVQLNLLANETLQNMLVDVPNIIDCDNAYAYFVKSSNNEIFVYRLKDNKHWSTGQHNVTNRKDKELNTLDVLSALYCGSAIINLGNDNRVLVLLLCREAYLVTVSTKALQNSEKDSGSVEFTAFGFREMWGYGTIFYDEKNSVLFILQSAQKAFICWNTKSFPNEFSSNTTRFLKFPSAEKLTYVQDLQAYGNSLMILAKDTGAEYPYLFHLYTVDLKDMLKGTICEFA